MCSSRKILVHHRKPGNSEASALVALCLGCHNRIHRLRAIRRFLHPKLIRFWGEFHKGPRQLQFPVEIFDPAKSRR